ncbi:hypothetical protein SprV_0501820500 [Sparganum proliferum]
MTVFFGRVYFAERVVFIPTPGHRDFEFRFDENGQHLVVINLNNDCSKGGQAYTCALRNLENVPVDRIIFSTGSMLNIQVYGSPGTHFSVYSFIWKFDLKTCGNSTHF